MDNIPDIEVVVAEVEKKETRGGKRAGAGRRPNNQKPSFHRENNRRIAEGLEPIVPPKKKIIRKYKSDAILPEKKKARHQEILAEMLGRKSQYIVQRVLEKAMDDTDKDQMECLKIVMDRVLPKDYLAKTSNKSNGITIQILGMDGAVSINETTENNAVDAEFEEVDG